LALISVDAVTAVLSAVAAGLGLSRPLTGGAAALAESQRPPAPRPDVVEFRLAPGHPSCDGPGWTRGGGIPACPCPRPRNGAGAQDSGRAAARELWPAGAV